MTVDATTWLFVPGCTPERFDKAVGVGAGAVILDLEDAVRPELKNQAREAVATWLSGRGQAWVRVNGTDTSWHADDVDAIAGLPGLRGVVLPKAEDPATVGHLADALRPGRHLALLIETALGVHRAVEVAAAGAARLMFGSLDYGVDIGCDQSHDALLSARSALVVASRLNRLPGPVDGVTTEVRDAELVAADAAYAHTLGFAGKLCIHPAQLPPAAAAFTPSEDDLAWARGVIDAYDRSTGTALGSDGRMIDQPVLDRARAMLRG